MKYVPTNRVKDMKPNQLEEAQEHAQAGKGAIKQGDLKLSGDDHQEAVQQSFEDSAENAMQKAVDKLRNALNRKDTRGASMELSHLDIKDSTTVILQR